MLTGDADEEVTNPKDVKQVTTAAEGARPPFTWYGMNRQVFWATAPTYWLEGGAQCSRVRHPAAASSSGNQHDAYRPRWRFCLCQFCTTRLTLVAQRMAEPVKKLSRRRRQRGGCRLSGRRCWTTWRR